MNRWEAASLDQLVEWGVVQLSRGKIISKADMDAAPGSFPVYSSAKENGGKFGEYGKYMFDEELITWSVDGGGRLFHRARHKFSVTNVGGILRILDQNRFEYRFLFYVLTLRHSEIRFDWVKKAHPSIIRKLYLDIPLLSISEQRRIVAILDEAFEAISIAKANAENNLEKASEILRLRLKLAIQNDGQGWVEKSVGDVCTLRSGTTVPISVERPAGDVPYLKVAEMTMPANRNGVTTSIRFLNRADVKQGWLIPAGSVIFPKRGGAILTNKKRLALVDMCADLNIMAVIPSCEIAPEFLYLYFLNVDMRKLGTGSSIPQINNYDIAPLIISFPESKEKQIEIASCYKEFEAQHQELSALYLKKIAALEELKKSILHQAFTGQL